MLNIKEILKTLDIHNVKYIVIGGTAAVTQGSVHLTFDFDICYARDKSNLENIVKALAPFHPTLRGAPEDLPFIFDAKTLQLGCNFTLSTDIGDIDLLGEITGLGNYNKAKEYSDELEIYGIPCLVLNLEGLIKSRKAVKREKDKILIIELEALLEIQKKGKQK